jgi:2-dehydropantoate 2-reductase
MVNRSRPTNRPAVLGPDVDGGDLAERARQEALHCYREAGIAYVDREQVQVRTSAASAMRAVAGHEHSGSSTVQSLQRGAGAVESDYLNGEIVLLGRSHGVATPVNAALARLARRMALEGLQPGELGHEAITAELARTAP